MEKLFHEEVLSKKAKEWELRELFFEKELNCGTCMVELNNNLTIVEIDDKYLNLTNNKRENIIGKSFFDFVATRSYDDIICLHKKISIRKEIPLSFILISGENKEISVYSYVCVLENNQKNYAIFRIIDDESILLFQKNVMGMFLTIPCGFICYGYKQGQKNACEMELHYANEEFYNIIGHTKEQFAEKHNEIPRILADEGDSEAYYLVRYAMENEAKTFQAEFSVKTFNGQTVYVLCNIVNISISKDIRYLVSTYQNITEIKKMVSKVEENKILTDILISNIPGGVGVFSVSDKILMVYGNNELYKIMGYKMSETAKLDGVDIYKLFYENEGNRIKKEYKGYIYKKGAVEFETKIMRKNGEIIWIEVRARLLKYVNDIPQLYAVVIDITKRKELEEEVYFQTERYKLIEELTEEMQFDYDVNTDIASLPEKYYEKLGIKDKIYNFMTNKLIKNICHPNDYRMAKAAIQEGIENVVKGSFEIRLLTNEKRYEWYRVKYASVANSENKVFRIVGKIINIDEEKRQQEKMELQIQKDSMTGLLNQTAIKQKIEAYFESIKILGNVRRHALLLIDIDCFKRINDTLGHMFGDIVIENIASGIKSVLRMTDLAGRIGGDEFLILLKDVDHEIVLKKAEDIRKIIDKIYVGEYRNIKVSACIGVSFFGIDGTDYETLFAKADAAMYYSKNNGKNRVSIYNDGMLEHKNQYGSNIEDENERNMAKYDVDFVQYSFSMLSNSVDIDSSINVLLERIGKRFCISDVIIFEHDEERHAIIETNHWNIEHGIWTDGFGEDIYTDWDGFEDGFDEKGILILEDCLMGNNVTKKDKEIFKERNIKALVDIKFTEKSIEGDGFIGYCDLVRSRKWTDYEIETFYQFTRIFSVFISIRKERRREKLKIEKLTMYDQLTNAYNLEAFKKLLEDKIKDYDQSLCYAICYSDIDDFSYVNDNFGYEAGNEILKCYADTLLADENSELVCRIYSDYFVVLYIAESKEKIISILSNVKEKFLVKQKEIYPASDFNLSIGVFTNQNKRYDIATVLDNANLARKSIKGNKEAVCGFYSKELRIARNDERFIMTSVHRAIKENELIIYLQPKIDIRNDKLVGAETLIRWKNYDGRLRFPDEFIPILEKIGYIVEMDFFSLEEALKCMKQWKNEGYNLVPVSVNFSRKHNLHLDFVDRIIELTKKYDIAPEFLEIEVTESCIADDSKTMLMNLERLKKLGYAIAIDDFGTGYSSLNLLLSAPVDVVKLDKSFINRYSEGNITKEYILKVCELIKAAGKEIIFEGVETREQAEFLRFNGYYMVQGYLYDKPLEINKFTDKYL